MSRDPVLARGDTTSLADRKRRAGQRLLLGLGGASLSADERTVAAEVRPAGFLLRPCNLLEAAQVVELCRELSSLLGNEQPAILALDLGSASRWEWSGPWPTARMLGEAADLGFTQDVARALGNEVAALGLHLMLGPTADVGIGNGAVSRDEVFGDDPDPVARQVHAFVTGLQEAGIGATVRNFPGCGGASPGTHGQVVDRDPGDLRAWDLRAFARVVRHYPPRPAPVMPETQARDRPVLPPVTREGVAAAVFLPQVRFPAFDERCTAACSPAMISGLLREEMDFHGLAIVGHAEGAPDAGLVVAQAVAAGADLALLPGPVELQGMAWECVLKSQEEDLAVEHRVELSDRRLLAFRIDFLRPWGHGATLALRARPPLECIGCDAHRRLATGERSTRSRS